MEPQNGPKFCTVNMWIITGFAAAFSAIDIVTAIPAGQVDRGTQDIRLCAAVLLMSIAFIGATLYVRKEKRCRRLKEWSNSFDIAMTEEKALLWSFNALRRLQCYSGTDFSRAKHGIKEGKAKTPAVWVAATAAPHHATGNRNLLSGFIIEHDDQFVHADGVPRRVLARGAVITDSMVLPDVWFVPGLTENLVSVSQLVELDHSVGFSCGECCIRGPDGKVVGNGHLQEGGHYVLDFLKVPLAI